MSGEKVGAIILAAGASRRLGEPKQFLLDRGETLVRRAARVACGAGCAPVIVVAGNEHARVAAELAGMPAQTFHHPRWAAGIGSSLRAGVGELLAVEPNLEALIVMVCDQPHVTPALLRELMKARSNSKMRGAACVYAGALGVPAIFDRPFFPSLLGVGDEQGAKGVLATYADDIARVSFPEGAIDIDTPADRERHLAAADGAGVL